MDKSIIIQKQIRDNADELHSFMRDLTNWEKEMKRKENLLHGEASQDIPPIRKKTKTSKPANETENVSPSQNPPENKPKKIASYDYRAWDKLDVDKLCKDLDSDSEDSGEEGKKTKVQKKSGSKSVPAKSPVTPTNASSTKSEISSNSGKSQEKNSKSVSWRSKPEYENQPPIKDSESFEDAHWKGKSKHEIQIRANYYKELGNEFVTAGEWNEAIRMYSNAINLYPVDSVFYANRALCYLKLQRYKDAQYDCDTALTHNDQYVKAYLRRAAAFENQGKYELAQKDFRTVLKFEPNNRAAKDGLASVHKKITSQNCTSNISSESKVKPPGCGSVKEKMLCTEGSKVTAVTPSESKIFEANKEEALVVRTWKSEENDPRVLMETVMRPAHLQSTKPLKRVKIEEVYCDYESPLKTNGKNLLPSKEKQATVSIPDSNSSAHKSVVSGKIQEIKADTSVLSQTSVKAELMEELKITSPKLKENQPVVKAETKVTEMGSVQNPENIDIPRIPISYVGFSNSWSLMQNEPEKRYLYLKRISGEKLPIIFGNSLENSVLSEIIAVLQSEFVARNEKISPFLFGLTRVQRFRALVLFLSEADKTVLRDLVSYCQAKQDVLRF
ncbi:RNA polymerase II-associated protein 3 [Bemisia tabaci]|uniref:RNA polymerase II-associated protein 3 n=1 Tax=Bemisia tabaci TaxID=7038 RepID=UPI003B28DB20